MEMKQIVSKLQNHTPTILGIREFSKYAVLLPLVEKEDGLHVLFEIRAYHLRRQPGEVCFPGGKVDDTDRNELETAVRETSEELGIQRKNIADVFPLDFLVTPFGTIIYPFVGVIHDVTKITPNDAEVAEIFTVPLDYFKTVKPEIFNVHYSVEPEENFPFELIIGGENYNWQKRQVDEYFYRYEGKVIWGLTARILTHFLWLVT
jgi:peroxisomal coenzyme A diphosphatase NUDT7